MRTTSDSPVVLDRRAAVEVDLRRIHLHEGDHGRRLEPRHLCHARQERVTRIDEVVSEEHGERLVADVLLGPEHGVAQALRVALADEVDVGERAGFHHAGEFAVVALLLQRVLELGDAVEMIGEGVLVPPDDDEDVVDSGSDGFFHDVLDRGLVDHREHLLRHGLGRRKEAGAEARRGDHGLDRGFTHGSTLDATHEGAVTGACPEVSANRWWGEGARDAELERLGGPSVSW